MGTLMDRPRGITIVPSVGLELADWLDRHSNHPLAQAVSLRDAAIELWDQDSGPKVDPDVFWYYLHLLAIRRRSYRVAERQLAERQSSADLITAEENVFRTIQAQLGERGVLLAKKGRAAAGSPTLCTDEKLVVGAVLHGLATGNPTMILTKDEDIPEQFYKCCWLLDTQYRGFLQARRFVEEPNDYKTSPLKIIAPQEHDFFEAGDHLLLHRPSEHLQEVLPNLFNPVTLHCVVAGVFHSCLSFTAEMEMSGLLEAKAATGGLNTDRLDGRNCHVWVPVADPSAPHGYAAIGHDRRFPLPHTRAQLSLMDANHVIHTNERFGRPYRSCNDR